MAGAGVISLESVSFRYGTGEPVIREVSAQARAGELTAIIGPNAAGKSTLLRLMLGHHAPDAGRILLHAADLRQLSPERRAALVAFVPSHGEAEFPYSVREVIAMGRHATGPSEAAVRDALDRCELSPLQDRVYAELSSGQQQRVLLARALAQGHAKGPLQRRQPWVLLLDEPVCSMDLAHALRTMTLLRDLAKEGAAVVVVLHDLNLAAQFCDSAWLLKEGRVLAQGAYHQVLAAPVLQGAYGVQVECMAQEPRPVFRATLPVTLDVASGLAGETQAATSLDGRRVAGQEH